ncbi:hypothetical protein C8R48DRAFT_691595 [Suillus tomentosus]|nr:hypothetical protein C8R48DRAFT_691595 [Suillus tomentosus]
MGMALIWLWPVQGSPTCFQVVEGYSKFQLRETRKPPLRTRSVLLINLVERTSGDEWLCSHCSRALARYTSL